MSAGFSLVESLVAMALTLSVTGTAIALVLPASRASMIEPERMDVQQRARGAAEMLARDIAVAGAGPADGLGGVALADEIPVVMPRRLGALGGDGPDVARANAITVLTVPALSSSTALAAVVGPSALSLEVQASASCGSAVLCGFAAGQDVLILDAGGQFDLFRITRVAGGVGTLRHHGQSLAWVYPVGARVMPVVSRTFEWDEDARQLRQYDGDQSDQPAVDAVSQLSFEYLGMPVAGVGALEVMPLSTFADGPWRGSGTTRFDADLLRVRAIRVRVTAEAADAALRPRVGRMGVTIDVAPRALGAGR